jgi:hypothetical protein
VVTLAVNGPDYTSQGTQIEQARATADVLAAMEAAKRWPRDLKGVRSDMLLVCQTERVAKTAFWSLPRGGKDLVGSSVKLMRTISAIFGNMSIGARQLHRDERNRHTEMQAWAWDLQSNFRIEETFIVPWIVDLKGEKSRPANSEREIRELCSAVAQRKVRVQAANVLPDWYVAEAEDTARAVIEQRDRPIEDIRREVGEMIVALGVPRENVLYRVGRDSWGDTLRGDLAVLRIAIDQINRGEASIWDLFPAPPVKVDAKAATTPQAGAKSVTAHAADQSAAGAAESPVEAAEPVDTAGEPVGEPTADTPTPAALTGPTRTKLMAICKDAGLDSRKDRAKRLRLFEIIADRLDRPVTTADDLSEEEGLIVYGTLRGRLDAGELIDYVAQTLREDDEARAADLRPDPDEPPAEEG